MYQFSLLVSGPGEGTSSGEAPQGPRKKRARVDPTVESVCTVLSLKQLTYHGSLFTYKAGKI